MDRTIVQPYEDINRKIYGYTLPKVPSHDGYIKVGETIQDTEERIKSQISTAGLTADILFQRKAKRIDGKWFNDTDLHRYFEQNGIERANFNDSAREWFYFDGYPEKAEQLTDKYIHLDYDAAQVDKDHSQYQLRFEQQKAVEATIDYYINCDDYNREFLWNAKPRFGKTLSTYDLVRRVKKKNDEINKATNVLIVTNRPAIANSWYDDYTKFISWQEPDLRFVSETDALKNKAMSHEEFWDELLNGENDKLSLIAFVSLQDLKGAEWAGGEYQKLEWVQRYPWSLLVVDEAHEGVDTFKTDRAFDGISRDFTLHLSGTPFKALADNKFNESQIYNWSYADEQEIKTNWDYSFGSNPYESLPTLNLFTYQMSRIVEEEVAEGKSIGDENYDYAFDLNEFFKVSNGAKFDHEDDVRKFLDNLASGRFPFSETEHRQELNHTLWLLSRVNSAKALEKMLREHPVFGKYEIILAAGDGKVLADVDESIEAEAHDTKSTEKSLDRVRKAIEKYGRTITLSVGQLTTGVTIPEWTGVLMLSDIASPALYFQAAFRSQNPHEFVDENGDLQRKENAYIFDFSPDRTLVIYDEFANNLSGIAAETENERKDNIRELLNFFPVIAEDDDGSMREIDASEVLTLPNRIKATEVVKRGFMSNLLFVNIAGIFNAPSEIKEILEKIEPEKNKWPVERRPIIDTKPMVNDRGEVEIPEDLVVSKTDELFGRKIYADEFPSDLIETEKLIDEIAKSTSIGFDKMADEFNLNKRQVREKQQRLIEAVRQKIEEMRDETLREQKSIEEEYAEKLTIASEEEAEAIQSEIIEKKAQSSSKFYELVSESAIKELESVVEESAIKVEESKKRTTEDDVRDHLRGFARTIPSYLMAYGDEETEVDNFEQKTDPDNFKELTSITVEEFRKLRDGFEYVDNYGNKKTFKGMFNKGVFNASIKEFLNKKNELSNYFDTSLKEDIYDYIPPQETNQIYTPKSVVEMMVDLLEEENPEIFKNPNLKFIDLYTKSGLYITELITRLYVGLADQITDDNERLKWIIENQVYAIAPSNIIYNIARNFIMGDFEDISDRNIVEYDLTEAAKDGTVAEELNRLYGENMKFDVVIGNPPYQEEILGENKTYYSPIYNEFLQASYKLADISIMIHPARFLFGAGATPTEWNERMLNDEHLKVVYYEADSNKIFTNTDIKGGIAITYRDKNKKYDPIGDFSPHEELNSVLKKVKKSGFISITTVMSNQTNFDLESLYAKHPEYRKILGSNGKDKRMRSFIFDRVKLFLDGKPDNSKAYVAIVGRQHNERIVKWIDRSLVEDDLSDYKIIIPKANGNGVLGEALSSPRILKPNYGYTQTFIAIRKLNTQNQAEAALKYVKSKFLRVLLGTKKVTQDAAIPAWENIPLQDFSSESDIEWSNSIENIDRQLYEKYDLNVAEINFIESIAQPMD